MYTVVIFRHRTTCRSPFPYNVVVKLSVFLALSISKTPFMFTRKSLWLPSIMSNTITNKYVKEWVHDCQSEEGPTFEGVSPLNTVEVRGFRDGYQSIPFESSPKKDVDIELTEFS